MLDVRFHLKHLEVMRQNDGGDGGSEPYLFVSYFKSDNGTRRPDGSLGIQVVTPASSSFRADIPNNLRVGAQVPVPASQGRHRMRVDTSGDCFCGMVIVCLEEDQTDADVIVRARNAVHTRVSEVILSTMRAKAPRLTWVLPEDSRNLRLAVERAARDAIAAGTGFFEDADEVVKASVVMMMGRGAIDPRVDVRTAFVEGNQATDESYRLLFDVAVSAARPSRREGLDDPRLAGCDDELGAVARQRQHVEDLGQRRRTLQRQLLAASPGQKPSILRESAEVRAQIDAAEARLDELENAHEACLLRGAHTGELR
jgi:hypothetical protein